MDGMVPAWGEPENTEQRWLEAPAAMSLNSQQIHVWRAKLPAAPGRMAALADDLDGDEQARAARFVFARDADRYRAWHGALRRILARYLNVAPDRVRYVFGHNGKPALAPGFTPGGLRFNLAHSGDMALVGVALGREVGVDVEQTRPLLDAESIAERYFSARERAALADWPAAERPAAFFKIWTGKEAFIKATGHGLSLPLDSFSVPANLAPGASAPVSVDGAGPAWAVRWLEPGPGYAAAVAAEGLSWEVACWQFE